jgi:hypothetical protein
MKKEKDKEEETIKMKTKGGGKRNSMRVEKNS